MKPMQIVREEKLTPTNHALCDWGRANMTEDTVSNVIGQKCVDFIKQWAVHLEP